MAEHNYLTKIKKLYAEGKIPSASLSNVDIYHDDWCAIYRGGLCDCDPDVVVKTFWQAVTH